MEPSKLSLQAQKLLISEEPIREPLSPLCPVCGSYTIPIRGLLRCLLCGFVLCESCEGNGTGGHA
jgi:hypothetical protein